ncbi:GNAT family N-acetyltransferase, partial [Akkermansia sp.]|uniref:GNAT family N-acetyltransferase n=1 Tax=Akkermansia sp. TaxID=1872421 RepID=UPI003AB5B68D
VENFSCGEIPLDIFLKEEIYSYREKGLSSIRFLINSDNNTVVGFSAISPCSLPVKSIPPHLSEQYQILFPLPCWLIGRLAVDKPYQRKKIGALLLFDAIKNILTHTQHGAGAGIVVDAKNEEVKNFYLKYHFIALPKRNLKLFLHISQARELIGSR